MALAIPRAMLGLRLSRYDTLLHLVRTLRILAKRSRSQVKISPRSTKDSNLPHRALPRKASTADRVGMPDWPPGAVALMAAVAEAKRTRSCRSRPRASADAYAP